MEANVIDRFVIVDVDHEVETDYVIETCVRGM